MEANNGPIKTEQSDIQKKVVNQLQNKTKEEVTVGSQYGSTHGSLGYIGPFGIIFPPEKNN
jgi:hypothetical protein